MRHLSDTQYDPFSQQLSSPWPGASLEKGTHSHVQELQVIQKDGKALGLAWAKDLHILM